MVPTGVLGAVLALWTGCAAPGRAGPAAPAADTGLRLELNLPAYRLDLYADGRVVRSYRVAVGTRRYRTPAGDFRIAEVAWNPWWYPPDSEWARGRKAAPPGPASPVGRVKLRFHETYHLHGTAEERSLGRAASHGCVRLSNPDVIDLARRIHRSASPGVPGSTLDRLESEPWRTATIPLAVAVPLRIVYEVAEVREGRLEVHPDVYRRVGGALRTQALRVLREHGIPGDSLDHARLDRVLEQGRRVPASIPLDELLRREAPVSGTSPADGIAP